MIVSLVIKIDIHINTPAVMTKSDNQHHPTLPVDCRALRSDKLSGTAMS